MSRRLTTCVLAAFYLLQATWLLHAGMDLLFPKSSTSQAASAAVCTDACGCPKETKALKDCCCAKHSATQSAPMTPRPASSIEEAKCKGIEDAWTQAFTQPAVCSFARIGAPIAVSSELPVACLTPSVLFTTSSLEKVPISQA